ncbi:hypothetical protein FRC05_004183 [Tulasnella sp. 425]|nr:hypothetical protein FRC05_004183 [Tulasnella sp. 425]
MLPEHRRAMLTQALEYASEAVKMDRSGYNVQGTIATYARCVSLLHELVKGGELSQDEQSRVTSILPADFLAELGACDPASEFFHDESAQVYRDGCLEKIWVLEEEGAA